ncbi:hypothetical protein ID866_11540 [Astraeus odoratus]|nr:hypothetical protein ID866_11540 [Astraeus odoratus]
MPTQLMGLHVPTFQFTKEFSKINSDKLEAPLQKMHNEYRSSALDWIIDKKEEELLQFEKWLTLESWYPRLIGDLGQVHDKVARRHRLPVLEKDNDGKEQITGWCTAPQVSILYDQILCDLPELCFRILAIEQAKATAVAAKEEAKKKAKDTADATPERRQKDLVDTAIRKRLKELSVTVCLSDYPPSSHSSLIALAGQRVAQQGESSCCKRKRDEERRLPVEKDGL